MELGQLRALREVQRRGSIAAAAAALHVTPSSVSQQLSALARASGTALTYKDGRRTALTPAGKALALAATNVEVALAQAEAAVSSFAKNADQTVSVAAFNSAGLAFFAPLAQQLERQGGPTVNFADKDVAQGAFAALTADFDVVIAHRLPNSAPWPLTVAVTSLSFEPLDVAVGIGHRLAGREYLGPEDLRNEHWISVQSGFALAGGIELIGTLAGEEAAIDHTINEFFVAASLVEAGGCISLMPRYTFNQRQFPGLTLLPLSQPLLGRHIDILTRPEALEREAVRAVIMGLQEIMASLRVSKP